MNHDTPETSLPQSDRIAELEQQLKLSDEGVSRLAQRCLSLEQEVQALLEAHPQHEMHVDSPALLQPVLYYDAGFGFSERDRLSSPDCTYDAATGAITATFVLPDDAQALRLDPGELPCCVTQLTCSDDRVTVRPANGQALQSGASLFLCNDPNFRLEGLTFFRSGMKLTISYSYFPLELHADDPLFRTLLESVRTLQKVKFDEVQHVQNLNNAIAEQQKAICELQDTVVRLNGSIAELRTSNEALNREHIAVQEALASVKASASWRLTAPLRAVTGLFHRGH